MQVVIKYIRAHILSILFALITLYLMAWIFSFSSEVSEVSNATSEGVCYFISSVFVKGFTSLSQEAQEAKIQELVPIVRKIAHFLIYAALGFFAYLTKGAYSLEKGAEYKWVKTSVISVAFCLLYAVSDEVHQLFVSGRSGSVRDVFIDLSGAAVGVCFAVLAFLIFIKIKNKASQK